MAQLIRTRRGRVAGAIGASLVASAMAQAQMANAPTNDAPNPYTTIENHFKLPAGRTWGSTSAVDIDKDGKSIWVAERCGANTCWDRDKNAMSALPVILKFDESGKLVQSFGTGIAVFPHGIHIDRDGNVWITDGNDNLPRRAPGAAARFAAAADAGQGRRPPGVQVQPRRQAAAHARQARWQPARTASRPGVVLPAQRRHHLSERRHPRGRRPWQRGAGAGAAHPLRQEREVPARIRQDGHRHPG